MSRVTWVDLAAGPPSDRALATDFCIVGAGAAGIYLTRELAERGARVVLVEAGPESGLDAGSIGFEAEFAGAPYSGATKGRYFGLGGSTTRWGGVIVPHTTLDLRPQQPWAESWAHIVAVVESKASQVLRRLGYTGDSDFTGSARHYLREVHHEMASQGLRVEAALHMPFSRRNFARWLSKKLKTRTQPLVILNAVAKSWVLSEAIGAGDGRLTAMVAVSHNGYEVKVLASKYVIAAGAIESARIALEINECAGRPAFRSGAAPGHYLSDHLSLPIAEVDVRSRQYVATTFAPRFEGPWMRSFRILEANRAPAAQRAFAHFVFDHATPGFDLAKSLLGAVQSRQIPSISAAKALKGVGGMAALGYARFARHRLHVPDSAISHLQLDVEQTSSRENSIELGSTRDRYGRRVARIHWAVSGRDMVGLRHTADHILASWSIGAKPLLRAVNCDWVGHKPHDAYHPVGTCRMGVDREAVVNTELKAWGVENLWLTTTGVLPSAGTANPTFTLLCLTHDLAERIALAS